MKNPLDQTFIHESIWFGRGLDLSHRVFVICIQQLCHNKICLTENTDGLNKEPFDRDDEKYMRISCIDKNRRQQKGEKILSFLYWIMFGKGKRIWHPSEEKQIAKSPGCESDSCYADWDTIHSYKSKKKCFIEKGIIHILYTF